MTFPRWVIFLFSLVAFYSSQATEVSSDPRLLEYYLKKLQEDPSQTATQDRLLDLFKDPASLESFLASLPGNSQSQIVRGFLQLRKNQLPAARAAFEQAAKEKPNAWGYRGLSEVATLENQPEQAAAALEEALKLAPSNELRLLTGDKWVTAGKPEIAEAHWQAALAASPTDLALHKQLAHRLSDLHRDSEVQSLWSTFAETTAQPADRFEALTELSKLQESRGQYAEAIHTLHLAAKDLAPESWQKTQLSAALLRLHRQTQTLNELETEWRQDLEANPNTSTTLRLASLLAEEGKFGDQRHVLRQALASDPDSSTLLTSLAEAERATGSPSTALKLYDQLISRSASPLDPTLASVDLLLRLNRSPEALARITSFMSKNPELIKDSAALETLRLFLETHRLNAPLTRLLRELAKNDATEIPALIEHQLRFGETPDPVSLDELSLSLTQKQEMATRLSVLFQQAEKQKPALEWAQKAVELDPQNPTSALRVADLLPQLKAAKWLEQWTQKFSTALPPEVVDQRLFQLSVSPSHLAAGVSLERSLDLVTSLPTGSSDPIAMPPLFDELKSQSETNPNPDAALRVARWYRWLRNIPLGVTFLTQASRQFPDSIAIRETLAEFHAELGEYATAITLLQKLEVDDATNALVYERKRAQYELARGEISASLRILEKQATEHPSFETWQTLAAAQSQADYWYDSLDSWFRAAEFATPTQRYALRTPILTITERLNLPDRAELFLSNLLQETPDPKRKNALRQEARDYASRTGTPLLTAIESPSSDSSAPPVETFASAKIRVLANSPNDPKAWLALPSLASPLELPTLWQEIITRFPRDPKCLTSAADYAQKIGDLATSTTLLSRALELGDASAQKHLELGKLYLELGNRDAALDHFETAWTLAPPAPDPSLPDRLFPIRTFGTEAQQKLAEQSIDNLRNVYSFDSSSAIADLGVAPKNALRLEMIRAISPLATGGTSRKTWLPRWRALSSPSEKITALVAMGEIPSALTQLEKLLQANPDNETAARSFFSFAVAISDYSRALSLLDKYPDQFSAWLDDFLLALNQRITAAPDTDLTSLWNAIQTNSLTTRALRWPLANLFALNHRYPDASRMGTLALDAKAVPVWSECALRIASWYLSAGNLDLARETAAQAGEDSAATFTSPALNAARMEWFLSTPDQQRSLLQEARQLSGRPSAPPLHAARYALFVALAQKKSELPMAIKRLLDVQKWNIDPSSDAFPQFVRESAQTLLVWGCADAASELLTQTVHSDPVLMLLRGKIESVQRDDLRLRLIATQLLAQPPHRLFELLRALIVETPLPLEQIQQFGLFFEQAGNLPVAYLCYETATELYGLTDILLAARLRTARNATDSQAWRDTCQLAATFAAENTSKSSGIGPAALSQLALIQSSEGAPKKALKLLTDAMQKHPQNEALVRQAVETFLLNHQPMEAQRLLDATSLPPSPTLTLLQIRTALESRQPQKAISLFQKNPGSPALLLPPLLSNFSRNGQLEMLDSEIAPFLKTTEDQFSLEETFAESLQGPRQTQALKKLKQLVSKNPNLLPSYYLLRKRLAQTNHTEADLIVELTQEWKSGHYFAGEILIQLAIENHQTHELQTLLSTFLKQPRIGEHALYQLAQLLDANQFWNESATVYQKLDQDFPTSATYLIGWAGALSHAGKVAEAAIALDTLHRARHLLPGALEALGTYYLGTDHPEIALSYFTEMKQTPNAQEQSLAYLGLTRCALALDNQNTAEKNLREAATLDLSPQVAELAAQLVKDSPSAEIQNRFEKLNLSPPFQQAAFVWLEKLQKKTTP